MAKKKRRVAAPAPAPASTQAPAPAPESILIGGKEVRFRQRFPVGQNYEFMDMLMDFWTTYGDAPGTPPAEAIMRLAPYVIESWTLTCADAGIEPAEGEECDFPPTFENISRLDMFRYGFTLMSAVLQHLTQLALAGQAIDTDGKS